VSLLRVFWLFGTLWALRAARDYLPTGTIVPTIHRLVFFFQHRVLTSPAVVPILSILLVLLRLDSASRVMSKMERRDSVVAASSSKKDPAPPLGLARATIKVRVRDDPNPRDDGLPYLNRLRGLIDHADSVGNAGRYGGGDVQWMTAGGGGLRRKVGLCFPSIHYVSELRQGSAEGEGSRLCHDQKWPPAIERKDGRMQGATPDDTATDDGHGAHQW
jgi:hypothetical protein